MKYPITKISSDRMLDIVNMEGLPAGDLITKYYELNGKYFAHRLGQAGSFISKTTNNPEELDSLAEDLTKQSDESQKMIDDNSYASIGLNMSAFLNLL